jgi:hypothetical protein
MERQENLLDNYDRTSAEQAYALCKAAVEAFPKEQLEGRYVLQDVVMVLDLVWSLIKQAKEDVNDLVKMPDFAAQSIEEIGRLRLAYWHASLEVEMSQSESKRKHTQDLTRKLRTIRRRLFGGIDVIWPDDKEMQDRLATLRKGQGHADLANDIVALVGLYRPRLQEASAWLQTAPLEALLDEGSHLAPMLITSRNDEGETTETEKKIDTQRRLFALLEDAYNEIASAGAYIFRRHPQHAEVYASTLRSAYARTRIPTPTTPPTPITP